MNEEDDRLYYVDITGTGQQINDFFINLARLISTDLREGKAWKIYMYLREIHSILFSHSSASINKY